MGMREIFIDTGGFFSLLVKNDVFHRRATKILNQAQNERWTFRTTDYVLDETVTLLKARRVPNQIEKLFDVVDRSNFLIVDWIGPEYFSKARDYFMKRLDQGYSFTDCTSFIVMQDRKIKKALTTDSHFLEAGFEKLIESESEL